jgi:plastocyanin
LQSVRRLVLTTLALALGPLATAAGHPGHGPQVVAIGEFAYAPQKVTVVAGDYVFWEWRGPDTDHSVTSDEGQAFSFESDPGRAPAHKVGDGWSLQFTKAGTWTYHCRTHSLMTGTVEVLDGGAAPVVTAPRLSDVRVAVAKHRLVLRFRVSEAVSMRATIRRAAGGPVLRELDFPGPPGANRRTFRLRGLDAGRYRIAVRAVDSSTGRATEPVRRSFTMGR